MSEQAAGVAVTIPGVLADYQLTIPGRLPGLNEYTAANRASSSQGAKMKRQNQELVMWYIAQQLRAPSGGQLKITRPVFMLFTFYEPNRKRDRDNVSSFARKVIQDALVRYGTLKDDGWGQVTGYMDRFFVDNDNPRIVVQFIEQTGDSSHGST